MMKFRNGSSVEALRRYHDPCDSWFPGTIVSADGNDHFVRYKFLADNEGEPVLKRVQSDGVRPLPLPEVGKRWKVGDIAEVFDNQCWRIGNIAKVLPKNCFVIRLFGSIQLKEFHESNIRVRKSWHNKKWLLIGKVGQDKKLTAENDSKYVLDLFSGAPSKKMGTDSHLREKGGQRCHEDENTDSKIHFLEGTVKRCHAENCQTNSRDLLIGGSRKKRKLIPLMGNPSLFKKVADISYSRVRMDKKFIEGSSEMVAKTVKATADWYHISSTPCWNEDSNQCSVASCSSNECPDYPGENFHKLEENISNSSDAESSFPTLSGKKHVFQSLRHKLDVSIHELELRAYESTVQALYASGPLSWEQESLLTNLRLSLNISDEEHLLQLRHLLSAQVV